MKLLIYIGAALLIIVLPFVFFVIGTITISGILACLGTAMGHNSFINCFHGILDFGLVSIIMIFITIMVTFYYFNQDEE
jgi:hypothetical protein